jgi:hypothetical protein
VNVNGKLRNRKNKKSCFNGNFGLITIENQVGMEDKRILTS